MLPIFGFRADLNRRVNRRAADFAASSDDFTRLRLFAELNLAPLAEAIFAPALIPFYAFDDIISQK